MIISKLIIIWLSYKKKLKHINSEKT